MIGLQVALVLLREGLRALLVPLRVLLYVPQRRRWRSEAQRALAEAAAAAPEADPRQALAAFLAQAKPRGQRPPHLFVSAGEASGEAHAAALLQSLPMERLRCTAFGGERLAAAGASLRFPLSEHAVMGVVAVLRHLPRLVAAFASYLRLLRDDPPDLVVLVDYPGLHLVMAKAAKQRGVPVLHYIAPQYWAWGPWRLRRYRRSVDATLTILPFETAFFRRHGVPAAYIGHPLVDSLAAAAPDPVAVSQVQSRPTLVLLPGSRRAEIRTNLPGMLQVARELRAQHSELRIVVAHVNAKRRDLLTALVGQQPGAAAELAIGPLGPWLGGARLVLAKSGTGSLEACLHGAPTVVVYQLRGPLASLGYHTILSVPWIAAANLVSNRTIVPEFCFHRQAGWQRVAAAVQSLWHEGPARRQMLADLDQLRQRLGAPGASQRTAAVVRACLGLEAS
ncbi:MAG: lipid-A-disaccharide synthase [Planctomycetes bacterium]|nr:lipid-A-disaccharide synthase [Planctomycetota bacterium]